MQDIIFPKHKKEILESLHGRPRPSREEDGRFGNYNKGKLFKAALALIAVGLLSWVIVATIARAEVTITPHKELIKFNDIIIASRASTTPKDAVGFQIMTIKDESAASIPATKKESVTAKATGVVVLYNLTSASQRLVTRTRLEAPNGKLYRITHDAIIPAARKVSGKLVPGSVEARVEAALPGADYNLGLSDFTIPGFKGTTKFSKFYGRSKTKMEGGFIGDRLIAPEEALMSARNDLKKTLADNLAKKAVDSIPPGWLMYKDGTFLDLAETKGEKLSENSGQGSVTLSESGTLRAVILNEDDLRSYTINHKLSNIESDSYKAQGLEALDFAISNRKNFSIENTETFTFSIAGEALLVAEIPTEPLKADLAGKAYGDRISVFRKYQGIETAEIKLFPAFLRSIPSSKDRISIKVNSVQ